MANPTNDFNTSNEIDIENRYENYNLHSEEKQEVWQTIQERDANINQETEDYNNEDKFKERLDKEYEELRSNEQPVIELNHNPPEIIQEQELTFPTPGRINQPNRRNLLQEAYDNVSAKHKGKLQDINNQADQKIDNLLEKAREDGRYNEPQQDYNQVANQEQDNDLDRDR